MFARDATLRFRISGGVGDVGNAFCISTSKFFFSARAGATNEVATSEVAIVFSGRPPACSASSPACLGYLALLAQRQNKRNESNRGVLDMREQGPHEIPNARGLLQQPALEFSGRGAHR
jgi:hypothetical protein